MDKEKILQTVEQLVEASYWEGYNTASYETAEHMCQLPSKPKQAIKSSHDEVQYLFNQIKGLLEK
jgi:hypothetical protein